ncbi:hypothetical protein [Pedobacter sp. SYP-B3415]|uniref:hypothetical protein n=1 Tax=Pedobacter sp. SYP-B3415 TaxID=2496641 RepID=UPI00101BCB8C|nr:hypothetical protein [Pedobacter sp. SYP-B3415]
MFKRNHLMAGVLAAAILCSGSASAFHQPRPLTPITNLKPFDPSYELFYDEYVYGALPIRITRTEDDGPKRLTLRIYAGSNPQPYYEFVDIEGTETFVVFTQYSGPYSVGVTLVDVSPL